jgi:23S rRNA pseudouridine955/2504/2580 synthase
VRDWVLYRDEYLLVLNKPPGLSVQGGSKLTHSLANYLSALQFDAADKPRLVHRLVRDTCQMRARAESIFRINMPVVCSYWRALVRSRNS